MNLERRVTALEGRVTDIETSYGEIMYETHRHVLGLDITLSRMADKLGVSRATDAEIDAAIEDRS
ncbi:hypothetical protein IU459_30780 [Nocardia amamiensis]|uniref:Uncharacterized protein n=1 Tax=Nocardia amamiensis TaxID=404578 RepID=A0ABS0CZ79_9NOCA|nr:hypothetical protein [Nocardia amamiensis]MBF6301899.1 hypothetical protein [Nocardia amamiensis]